MIKHKLRTIPFIKESSAIIFSNLVLIILVLLLSSRVPPVVPLLYGKPQGVGQLAPRLFLTIPPIIAITFTLINVSLSYVVKDGFIQRALTIASATVTILSGITVVRIATLVGNF